jgi:hypothetical protein
MNTGSFRRPIMRPLPCPTASQIYSSKLGDHVRSLACSVRLQPDLGDHGMSTCRVMCPLLSQSVTLLARNGSVGAGCTLPFLSNARDVTEC